MDPSLHIAAMLDFQNIGILGFGSQKVKMHHHAKFHGDR